MKSITDQNNVTPIISARKSKPETGRAQVRGDASVIASRPLTMLEHKKLVHTLRMTAHNLRKVVIKLTSTLGKSDPAIKKLYKINDELCVLRAKLDVKMRHELGDAWDGEHYRSRGTS